MEIKGDLRGPVGQQQQKIQHLYYWRPRRGESENEKLVKEITAKNLQNLAKS